MPNKLRKLVSTLKIDWEKLILIVAVSMMIISALTLFFLVRQHEPQLSALRMEAQDKQTLIRDVWNNIGKKESKADTAILISLLASKNNKEADMIKSRYLMEFPTLKKNATPMDIYQFAEKEKKSDLSYIDSLYLQQNSLQMKIMAMERSNKHYSDFAFFLQTFSLVMIILKRDLFA